MKIKTEIIRHYVLGVVNIHVSFYISLASRF